MDYLFNNINKTITMVHWFWYRQTILPPNRGQCSCGYLWTIKSAWSWQWFSKTLVARPLSEPQTPLHKTGSLPYQTACYQITCRRYQITYIVHIPLRSHCPEMCVCMHGCMRACACVCVCVCVWIRIWIFVANVSHTGGTLQISTIIIIINLRLFKEFVSA